MTRTSLRLLLDFDACAQRDLEQSAVFLHRRDRKFALTCQDDGIEPSPANWMAYINRFNETSGQSQEIVNWFTFWRRVNVGFMLAGLLFGMLSMLGLLFYEGGDRINITFIIAFAAFQVLLALFTTLQSMLGWQPWLPLLRRFQKQAPSGIGHKLHGVLMAKAAHIGGIAFAIAGIVTLILMVVLQDLAFGWSTTIATSAELYYRIVAVIAAPWSWIWPAAAPDLALVEATRFFRASMTNSDLHPARWGQWWPFVAMLWTCYLLLPRVILCITAIVLVKRKAQYLLTQHPAMQALQNRMETPSVSTGNDHNDATDAPDLSTQLNVSPLSSADVLLSWAGAADSQLPTTLTQNKTFEAKVGGRISLADDQRTLEQVAALLTEASTTQASTTNVLLVTRSWEPPTGELDDFIKGAQTLWPDGSHVVLVPLATDVAKQPDKHHLEQWLRFAQRSNTGFVSVSVIPSPDQSTPQSTEHHS